MGKKHTTTVTHLEMRTPPSLHCPPPSGRIALMRANKPTLHFYRYIHDTIGRDYMWVNRRNLSDEALTNIIQDENVEIYIFYKDGVPAGFFELDFRKLPKAEAEFAFLGVMPDFIGQNLGRYLLVEGINRAWQQKIDRLIIQTCTFDHPRALGLYQRHGFTPYAQQEAILVEPEA
ncbi:MAG: GNAT family N-acetyltransferase [Parvibaculaceae bacterium]|nr:GNAT family N-acetyltransferase [Parvibaculaceae bacterium]